MKYIKGSFTQGERVTVEIDGKQYTRKVFYKRDCGLYITVNNRMYFEYECNYGG